MEHDSPGIEPNEFSELGSKPLTDETVTQDLINEMKMLGIEKPQTISWERWQRIKDIRHEHEHMIHLAASGVPQWIIAQRLGYEQAQVSKVLNHPEVKKRIKKEVELIYGADHKKAVTDLGLKAIGVVSDVLDNGKDADRASMAKFVVEHSIGKASQDIKVTKTTLSEVLVEIRGMQSSRLREVGPNGEILSKPKDHFDTIIEQVIPQGMVIGKRSGGSNEGKT